jgi:ADP-ribosyl-[dinitrogen reductase] hydrolase
MPNATTQSVNTSLTPPTAPLALRDRSRGCLLGGAVGDALGAPVEFASLDTIRHRFGSHGITEFAPAYGRLGAITDDTQMTLWTAEGLIRAWVRGSQRGISTFSGCVGHAYLRWLRTQGHRPRPEVQIGEDGWLWGVRALWGRRAPGTTCLSALKAVWYFGDFPDNDSKGCGGVMRVAPAGFIRSFGRPFTVGCDVARLTHCHPSGYLAAGYFAAVIASIADGCDLQAALRAADADLAGCEGRDEVVRAVAAARTLAAQGRADVLPVELGAGWVAEEALAIALWCALVGRDFRDAVTLAVNHGGDSDSTGSLTGQLLGALHGPTVIPVDWLEPVELREEIERLADDLATAFGDPTADAEVMGQADYPGW